MPASGSRALGAQLCTGVLTGDASGENVADAPSLPSCRHGSEVTISGALQRPGPRATSSMTSMTARQSPAVSGYWPRPHRASVTVAVGSQGSPQA